MSSVILKSENDFVAVAEGKIQMENCRALPLGISFRYKLETSSSKAML
jgi:hypothetical protein